MKENNQLNRNYAIALFFAFLIIFGSVKIYWDLRDQKANSENLITDFRGSVSHIEYDIKQCPTIAIGNSSYYIGAGYDTDHQIEVGDSMIKKKGSTVYKLIKHKTGLVIEFKK